MTRPLLPAIFLYVDPAESRAQFENTVAHELHHIGAGSLEARYEESWDRDVANFDADLRRVERFFLDVTSITAARPYDRAVRERKLELPTWAPELLAAVQAP